MSKQDLVIPDAMLEHAYLLIIHSWQSHTAGRLSQERQHLQHTDMAQETNQSPVLCAMGCGFYGNPRTSGMCSVCYKEHLQRQQSSGRMSPMGPVGTSSVSNSSTSEASAFQRLEASLSISEATSASTADTSSSPEMSKQDLVIPDAMLEHAYLLIIHSWQSHTAGRLSQERQHLQHIDMAQETNQSPVLCAMGCGFYGNPRTSGMCSVCYKEHLQRQQSSGRMSPMGPVGTSSVSNSSTSEASAFQRLEASLSISEATSASTADTSRGMPAASLPVTQQMTEMSISREEKVTTPKAEAAEPGSLNSNETFLSFTVLTQPTASASHPSAPGSDEAKAPELPKTRKNRCFMCRKKVGLTGFGCRCGNLFCGLHRYSDQHNCPYDYKAEAAEKIRKENPVVVADKIQRI
ncbi:UNVERIFIED_CONTAM: hypothetical protein FKN15_077246 [Acipenser sinensis]